MWHGGAGGEPGYFATRPVDNTLEDMNSSYFGHGEGEDALVVSFVDVFLFESRDCLMAEQGLGHDLDVVECPLAGDFGLVL